jgi:hypothetical protein
MLAVAHAVGPPMPDRSRVMTSRLGVGREANNPTPQKNIVTKPQGRPRPTQGRRADDDYDDDDDDDHPLPFRMTYPR